MFEVFIVPMCHGCILCVTVSVGLVIVSLCFLHRQCSRTAPRNLSLLTSRKSHQHMNEMICLFSHSDVHSSLVSCCLFIGEGTHSPQSGYVQQSPTTAPHRPSDRSTFTHDPLRSPATSCPTFLCHLPGDVQRRPAFTVQQHLLVWNQTELGQH